MNLKGYFPETVLTILSAAVLVPHLGSFFTSDDFLVLERASLFTVSDLTSPYLDIPVGTFFRPIASFLYYLASKPAFSDPLIYHLVSFMLHSLNCILFYRFLLLLSEGFSIQLPAFVAAAIVAVHPRTQETIAAIYCFPDLMVVSCSLLALILFARYLATERKIFLGLSLLSYVLALGCKENAFALLLLLFPLSYAYPRRQRSVEAFYQMNVIGAWFLLATMVFLVIRFLTVGNLLAISSGYTNLSIGHAGMFITKGIAAFIVPLTAFSVMSKTAVGIVVTIGAAGFGLLMWIRRESPGLIFSFAFIAAAIALLLPASMYSFSLSTGQENRFLYASLYPLSALGAMLLSMTCGSRRVLQTVVVVLVGILLGITNNESEFWKRAARVSEQTLESYISIIDTQEHPPVVLLDGAMYLDGVAVGVTSAALRMAPVLLGESVETTIDPVVLTSTGYESGDRQPVAEWRMNGDTLRGRSTINRPVFLGPVRIRSGKMYLPSPDGITIEARDYDPRRNMSFEVAVYPFSRFSVNTLFLKSRGNMLELFEPPGESS